MGDVWFRKLGFSRNPFTIKPAAFSYELIGPNINEVISGIEEGKLQFVEAPLGFGKTTMLKGIVHWFGGRKKVVYVHAFPSEKLDVKGLLKRSSVANFITGSIPDGMILVVDEAQNLTRVSSAEIMELYKGGNIRAVVLFGANHFGNPFVNEMHAAMSVIRLSRPTPEQAVSLVRNRIGNLSLISNENILSAYQQAQGSPRRLLQICEDICRTAVEGGEAPYSPGQEERESEVLKAAELRVERLMKPARASRHISKSSAKAAVKTKSVRSPRKVKAAVQARPAKANRRVKCRNGRKNSRKAAATDSVTSEGRYWGEFMGMQK